MATSGEVKLEESQVQSFDSANLSRPDTTRGASARTNEYAIKFNQTKKNIAFTFVVNPAMLKVSRKKLGQWTLTKFGYERQNWGNDLIMFEYSGCTGVFRPESGNYPTAGFDITQTAAWIKFKEFEKFYFEQSNDSELVRMQFWGYGGAVFQGTLDEFSFTYDPMKEPFVIRYQFKYTCVPVKPVDIQTGIVGTRAGDPDFEKARVDTVD